MFFKCPKCNTVWQYPIEKCPDCFSNLERIESKNIKVIGASRVTIPTTLHPNVPYFVLLLKDEAGNKWVQKFTPHRTSSGAGPEKEYKIGDKFEIKSSKNESVVAIWRVKYDYLEAIEKLINLLGNIKIDRDSKILILPTLISSTHPHLTQNTPPEILDSLIKFLIQEGVTTENISVAGQSFNEFSIEACVQKSKLLDVAQKHKTQVIDLAQKGFRRLGKENSDFETTETLFENDLIINLPVLKLDSKLGIKGALENLTKLLKKETFDNKKKILGEENLLLKLQTLLPEILTIADGTRVLRTDGISTFLGVIMASFNPLNLDRVFVEIAQINLPEYLKSTRIEEIEIVGRQIDEIKFEIEKF